MRSPFFVLSSEKLPDRQYLNHYGRMSLYRPQPIGRSIILKTLFALSCLGLGSLPLAADEIPRVDRIQLKLVSLPRIIRIDGTLAPRHQANLSSEVGGTLAARHIQLGQWVKKDQILLHLDPQRWQIQQKLRRGEYTMAQRRLDLTSKTWQRVKQLHSDGTANQEEFDHAEFEFETARAQLTIAQAALDLATLDLEKSTLRAPFAGEVAAILVDLGEPVAPGQTLVSLAATDTLIARAAVSAQELLYLERGLQAQIKPGDGSSALAAILHSFSRIADPQTHRYNIEIIAANDLDIQRAFGALATITLTSNQHLEGVLVAEDALRSFAGQTYAYVLSERDGQTRLSQRPVGISRELEGGIFLITTGLSAGEFVATGGALMVDGLRVEIKHTRRNMMAPER
ncbi:MAG: RND family efflux transporter MFP subunit [Planctomycetota bacterium]